MKKTIYLITIFLNFSFYSHPQTPFPFNVQLLSLDGQIVNSSSLTNNNELVMIEFWHSTSSLSIMFLDAVRDNYEEWQAKTNCKIIAIAGQKMDKNLFKLINEKQWPFEVYFDPEYDLLRALSRHHNKNDVRFTFPKTFVFNGDWEMLDKIDGIKHKVKDGIVRTADFKLTMDMLKIDLKAYYEMCDRYKNNNLK